MIGSAWWAGMAAGIAGIVAVLIGHWRVAVGLGLLALVCAVIVGRPEE
jgi:uncharacterized membrane protein